MGWFGSFAGMFCVKGLGRHFLRGGWVSVRASGSGPLFYNIVIELQKAIKSMATGTAKQKKR